LIHAGLPSRSNIKPPDQTSILNKQRPSNPFTPTEEPDWVVVGDAPSRMTSTSRTTSQHRLDYPASTGSRTLPPPFTPGQLHSSKDTRDPMRVQAPYQEPRSRASSQVSTKSTTSSMARKPAPPIPKKPALLTRPSDLGISLDVKANAGERSSISRPPPAARNISTNGVDPEYPLPPQRMTGAVPTGASGVQQPPRMASSMQQPSESDGRLLPPRRTGTGVSSPKGLMDEDNEGASAIPSLQPTRRK